MAPAQWRRNHSGQPEGRHGAENGGWRTASGRSAELSQNCMEISAHPDPRAARVRGANDTTCNTLRNIFQIYIPLLR